jgi:hydroxymethylbilane synthase
MAPNRTFRIGTRASKLARWQSDWVAARMTAIGVAVEIVAITTSGDVQQQGPVARIGVQGVFTKEIQSALLAGHVDLAVHSLKDLPTLSVDGLALAAVPPRENPADALVAAAVGSLAELPSRARVGTASVRRRAQLLHLRPDLDVLPIRGNVDTRLRKLDAGEFDAVVLASAGLNRLGLAGRVTELLAPPRMLPAPGQGAMAVECRANDPEALQAAAQLDDAATRLATTAERALLAALHGGCSAPIAAWGRLSGARLMLDALVAEADGRRVLRTSGAVELAEFPADFPAITPAVDLGRRVADALLEQGAGELIAAARTS